MPHDPSGLRARVLRYAAGVWIFPLAAAAVAAAFALALTRRFVAGRHSYQALWALALAMYAAASFLVFYGLFLAAPGLLFQNQQPTYNAVFLKTFVRQS